jgi:hypothetical protein
MADPVTIALVGGAVLQGVGQGQAAKKESEALAANAELFREQQKMAELSLKRDLNIFDVESDIFLGGQMSAIAKAGVELSGTALMQVATSKGEIGREKEIMERNAKFQIAQTGKRADQAQSQSDYLTSNGFRNMLLATTAGNAATAFIKS